VSSGPSLIINKTGGIVSAAAGTTTSLFQKFTLTSGTFTAPTGNLDIGGIAGASPTIFSMTGGTFNHNNGTVRFVGYQSTTATVSVPSNSIFYSVSVAAGNASTLHCTVSPMLLDGNFSITGGHIDSDWQVQGNITNKLNC
jgi:hypothetical protein